MDQFEEITDDTGAFEDLAGLLNRSPLNDLAKIALLSNMLGRLSVAVAVNGTRGETMRALCDRNFSRGVRDARVALDQLARERAH